MAEPRRYIGVRISEQGHRYIQLVAQRDRITYSESLRRLLAVGARTDMEAHLDERTADLRPAAGDGAGRSDPAGHVGESDRSGGSRDRDGEAGSGSVPHVPHSGTGSEGTIGDAIGTLIRAGFCPEAIPSDAGSPGAA